MKIIIVFLILNIYFYGVVHASPSIYESNFFEINIISKNISEDKIKEIEKIKYISLYNILEKILDKKNLNNFKKRINLKKEINYLIKNINIEEEFIFEDRYSAKIRINFDNKEIITMLRNNKINYSDFESDNLSLIVYEDKGLIKEGLSLNNTFYKKFSLKKLGLLNFEYPDLSPNDRYILPFKKIEKINLKNISKLSKKYNSKYSIILKIKPNNQLPNIEISFYSLDNNKIVDSIKFNSDPNTDYLDTMTSLIDEWWKSLFKIDHSIINKTSCIIKNSNIHELYFIISKINSISQMKSLNLLNISLDSNKYEINYYGDPEIFFLQLKKNKIYLTKNNNIQCELSLNK